MGGLVDAIFGGGGDAPPPPDYAAAAKETSAGNLEAAKYATRANRINQYTPYGSLTYSESPSGQWSQQMNLTPQAQSTLDKQMALSNQYADTASKGFANVQGLLENPNIDLSGIPEMRGIDMSQVSGIRDLNQEGLGNYRDLNTANLPGVRGINLGMLGDVRRLDAEGLQNVRQLTQAGLPQAPINAGQTAQDAIFSRLNPTLERDEEALRTRLANQGVTLGSDAYNREIALAGQRANDLRLQAAAQGISLDQAARQQAFGENQALSNFDMALQGMQFGQRQAMSNFDASQRAQRLNEQQAANQADLAQRGMMFGENQAMTNADLARQNQLFGQRQAIGNFDIARANQQFGQQQDLAALSGNQRNQALQEAYTKQSRPLDLINALRTGAQVQNPQFQNFAQQQTTTGPNMSQAAQLGYEGQMGLFNAGEARDERRENMMMQAAGMFF